MRETLPQASFSVISPLTQGQPEKPSRTRTCGECRRLKLKCDRVFPCKSCIKRGCEGICPEGSLVSGRGSRYILANTEQLHEKIVRMSERIRGLEDALGEVSQEHARCLRLDVSSSGPAHPLLRGDLLLIKNQLELYGPDRCQFAPKSDASGEQLKLGIKRPLSHSPQEALLLSGPAALRDSQFEQYAASDASNSPTQMFLNSPMTGDIWSLNSYDSGAYQDGMQITNCNEALHVPYGINAMPDGDNQLWNHPTSGASRSFRDATHADSLYNSDAGQYFSPGLFTHAGARVTNHFDNKWNLERRSN